MSLETPPSQPATSPQIGVDEWVSRSGERTTGAGGLFGFANRAANKTPPIVLLLVFVGLVCVIPLLTSNGYVIGVDADTMLFVLLAVGLMSQSAGQGCSTSATSRFTASRPTSTRSCRPVTTTSIGRRGRACRS